MKIRVLASESMGVRSLATVVEVHGYKICIDPGASLAPRRYGLPPHSIELEELGKRLNTIRNEVRSCDIIIITHYHRDHYLYRDDEIELYNDKILFIKDPRRNINFSQRLRAHNLLVKHGVEKKANTVFYADGKTYDIEGVKLFFSKPVPHGAEGTKLGYVLMVLIDDGEDTMAFASDVQGPISGEAYRMLGSMLPCKATLSPTLALASSISVVQSKPRASQPVSAIASNHWPPPLVNKITGTLRPSCSRFKPFTILCM